MLSCPAVSPKPDRDGSGKHVTKKKDTNKEVPQKFICEKSINIEGNWDSHGSNNPAAETAASSFKVFKIGKLAIQMKEYAATDYGLYLWPCSIILGCYLHQNRQELCKGLSLA